MSERERRRQLKRLRRKVDSATRGYVYLVLIDCPLLAEEARAKIERIEKLVAELEEQEPERRQAPTWLWAGLWGVAAFLTTLGIISLVSIIADWLR